MGSFGAPVSAALRSGCQNVTDATDRLDQHRMPGIRLDLLSQPGDLGVDAAIEHLPVAPAREIHVVPVQDPARIARQGQQQVELARRSGTSEPSGDVG